MRSNLLTPSLLTLLPFLPSISAKALLINPPALGVTTGLDPSEATRWNALVNTGCGSTDAHDANHIAEGINERVANNTLLQVAPFEDISLTIKMFGSEPLHKWICDVDETGSGRFTKFSKILSSPRITPAEASQPGFWSSGPEREMLVRLPGNLDCQGQASDGAVGGICVLRCRTLFSPKYGGCIPFKQSGIKKEGEPTEEPEGPSYDKRAPSPAPVRRLPGRNEQHGRRAVLPSIAVKFNAKRSPVPSRRLPGANEQHGRRSEHTEPPKETGHLSDGASNPGVESGRVQAGRIGKRSPAPLRRLPGGNEQHDRRSEHVVEKVEAHRDHDGVTMEVDDLFALDKRNELQDWIDRTKAERRK